MKIHIFLFLFFIPFFLLFASEPPEKKHIVTTLVGPLAFTPRPVHLQNIETKRKAPILQVTFSSSSESDDDEYATEEEESDDDLTLNEILKRNAQKLNSAFLPDGTLQAKIDALHIISSTDFDRNFIHILELKKRNFQSLTPADHTIIALFKEQRRSIIINDQGKGITEYLTYAKTLVLPMTI